jgi:uncharacterized protein YegL
MTPELQVYRDKLRCNIKEIDDIFEGCMNEALGILSEEGVDRYLEAATLIGNLGRGTELVLIFLEGMPGIAKTAGEELIPEVADVCVFFSGTANGKAINPFLSTLPAVTRRLEEADLLRVYFKLLERMAKEADSGLIPMIGKVPQILNLTTVGGLQNWMESGLRGYRHMPHKLPDYFNLESADSKAALQRERHGTLFVDNERKLELYLKAFWDMEEEFHPFSVNNQGSLRATCPHLDSTGLHIPDVYDDLGEIRGIDRYRAMIAHMMAHRRYSTPYLADNYSPFQQLYIEVFEDARVEYLTTLEFPGLHRLWLALHPTPEENACPDDYSPVRHKMAMLSRALIDPEHPYTDPVLLESVRLFKERLEQDPYDINIATELGIKHLVGVQSAAFRKPKIWFKDTEASYRDDNRFLWMFLEDTEDEDEFHSDYGAANPKQLQNVDGILYSRHHPEWDYQLMDYRPDWATVYESIHTSGSAGDIDKLLLKHKILAKKLKRIVDLLKPQQHVRERFKEDGDELDLDIAIRSMVEYKSGTTPDPRIHMSHKTDGRDIAVSLLLDLSESIKETPKGCEQSILQLSQEAVSLLAWAIDELGDPFAIAGFASNTRHDVRYQHFKGFNEPWDNETKARLAAMEGGYSTRMGTAIRHAGHYLSKRDNAKKLMFILTDGEPSDIDVQDPQHLMADTKKAVEELQAKGVICYCISLDPHADDYVSDIFGNNYTVIDHVEKLPEQLPRLFMALTK